jgi:uncharacterized membrane protein YqjE
MTQTRQQMNQRKLKAMMLVGLIITIILYAIMIPVALVTTLIWYAVTWPWYLWRAVRTVAWPRPFRI